MSGSLVFGLKKSRELLIEILIGLNYYFDSFDNVPRKKSQLL